MKALWQKVCVYVCNCVRMSGVLVVGTSAFTAYISFTLSHSLSLPIYIYSAPPPSADPPPRRANDEEVVVRALSRPSSYIASR